MWGCCHGSGLGSVGGITNRAVSVPQAWAGSDAGEIPIPRGQTCARSLDRWDQLPRPPQSGGRGDQALEQTAQGSDGIISPGSVRKMCKCGSGGHGLVVELAVLGYWLDLMILAVFPNCNGSVIL